MVNWGVVMPETLTHAGNRGSIISPANELVGLLEFLYKHHTHTLLMALGQVMELDPRLKYALMSSNEELRNSAILLLATCIGSSPSAQRIFKFLLETFPDAMQHFSVSLLQPVTMKTPVPEGTDHEMR